MYAVANGKVDAGATGDNVYDRMVAAGEIDSETISLYMNQSQYQVHQ